MITSLAIIGALSGMGKNLLSLLYDTPLKTYKIYALDAKQFVGENVPFGDTTLPITDISTFPFQDCLSFVCTADLIQRYQEKATLNGGYVIDCTGGCRATNAPEIIGQLNFSSIQEKGLNTICIPENTTFVLALLGHLINLKFGLKLLQASCLLSALDTHENMAQKLQYQTRAYYTQTPIFTKDPILAFNIIPEQTDDLSVITQKQLKSFGISAQIASTFVPVLNGDSAHIHLCLKKETSLPILKKFFQENALFLYTDSLSLLDILQTSKIGITKLRRHDKKNFSGWILWDNLMLGRAKNALDIAQKLLKVPLSSGEIG